MSLNKLLEDKLEELEKELDEANATGGGEAYDTPNAFSKDGKEDENENAETSGYKKVKESKFMTLAKQTLVNEVSYKEYKSESSPWCSPKK